MYLQLNTYPFDDDKGFYDNDTHQYYPELNYIKDKTGVDMTTEFDDDDELERNKITDYWYAIMYDTANMADYQDALQIKEYRAAKDHKIRTIILDSICWYIEACVQSSIDKTGNEHGKNYETGTKVIFKRFEDLSQQAQRKMKQTGLFYTGKYTYRIKPEDVRNGY